MDTLSKLEILADAAKYDAACTSSGVSRGPQEGSLGIASNAGCCHTFTADGRCVTLLKVLMSNACSYDCAYCTNRRSASRPRATFTPRELAQLTIDFYKRNYIEGLFLSSGVMGCADATTERMIECLRILREEMRFRGYIHAKAIPGTSPELIDELGRLADRISVNIELPSEVSLTKLCPDKTKSSVLSPMAQIADSIKGNRRISDGRRPTNRLEALSAGSPAAAMRATPRRATRSRTAFAPAGQSTQLIIGASPEDDNAILKLTTSLYDHFDLKRIFFSAYMPVIEDAGLPALDTPVPLRREHRLYQADWLLRKYGFTADEIVSPQQPWLDLDVDPKLAWALTHMERFPIEVNDAPLDLLLRIPGIGPTGARRIIRARKGRPLTLEDLTRLHVTLRRARHFITCSGRRDPSCPADEELIRRRVVSDATSSSYNRTRRNFENQLTLF